MPTGVMSKLQTGIGKGALGWKRRPSVCSLLDIAASQKFFLKSFLLRFDSEWLPTCALPHRGLLDELAPSLHWSLSCWHFHLRNIEFLQFCVSALKQKCLENICKSVWGPREHTDSSVDSPAVPSPWLHLAYFCSIHPGTSNTTNTLRVHVFGSSISLFLVHLNKALKLIGSCCKPHSNGEFPDCLAIT